LAWEAQAVASKTLNTCSWDGALRVEARERVTVRRASRRRALASVVHPAHLTIGAAAAGERAAAAIGRGATRMAIGASGGRLAARVLRRAHEARRAAAAGNRATAAIGYCSTGTRRASGCWLAARVLRRAHEARRAVAAGNRAAAAVRCGAAGPRRACGE